MGVTIQFESHRNELAAIYAMEHASAVVEYWDQPRPSNSPTVPRQGAPSSVLHTPDFFVLRTDTAGWEEWKLEDDLRRLAERQPSAIAAPRRARGAVHQGSVCAGLRVVVSTALVRRD